MGTKNNPGKFDCYANAQPDEPMFVLLGRDPAACALVTLWADIREAMGEDPSKIAEARQCASALTRWAIAEGKQEKIVKAVRLAANAMGSWTRRDVDEFLRRILPIDWSEPQVVTVVARAEMGK